jgi:hypothetical protein
MPGAYAMFAVGIAMDQESAAAIEAHVEVVKAALIALGRGPAFT